VTGIYVRSNYEPEMFDAMRQWSAHVAKITGDGAPRKAKVTGDRAPRKVLPFKQRAAATP
jgi:hypothetical protein